MYNALNFEKMINYSIKLLISDMKNTEIIELK